MPQLHVIPGTDPVLGDLLLWDSDSAKSAAFADVLMLTDGMWAPVLHTKLVSQYSFGESSSNVVVPLCRVLYILSASVHKYVTHSLFASFFENW